MRSKVAAETSRVRATRLAAMSPAERVALSARLGEQGIASYMLMHRLERNAAVARIKASHRFGRRPSRCADR